MSTMAVIILHSSHAASSPIIRPAGRRLSHGTGGVRLEEWKGTEEHQWQESVAGSAWFWLWRWPGWRVPASRRPPPRPAPQPEPGRPCYRFLPLVLLRALPLLQTHTARAV